MRTRVKVCCIASVEEARLAIQNGADALGLVGRMPSGPGPISDAAIAAITAFAPPAVATFLLTAETEAEAISAHVRRTRPTCVQIVSPIAPVQAARLACLEPAVKRVQVVHVEGWDALDRIAAYAPHVHAFLLDSGRPNAPVAELGGTGRAHDWAVSAAFVQASPLPVFLAGGLWTSNAIDAVTMVKPYGLDLCSGIRTDGQLDAGKLGAFMDAVAHGDRAACAAPGGGA